MRHTNFWKFASQVKELRAGHVEWFEHPGWVLALNKKHDSSCLKGLGRATLDNGKLVVRRGRKATGLHGGSRAI